MSVSQDTELILHINDSQLLGSQLGQQWWEELARDRQTRAHNQGGPPVTALAAKIIAAGDLPRLGAPVDQTEAATTYSVPAGISVCSYDPHVGRVEMAALTHFTVFESVASVDILTARKRVVTVAHADGAAVFDRTTGTLMPCCADDALFGLAPFVKREPRLGSSYNRKWGWFHGSVAADGWLKPSMVGYSKNDPNNRAEVVRIARACAGDSFTVKEYLEPKKANKFADSAKLHLFGRTLRDAVHDCYCPRGEGRGALYKMLPEALLATGSRECHLGMLAALFDGDSTLGWARGKDRSQAIWRTNTSSWCFASSQRWLGRLLGLRVSITDNPPRGRSEASYSINWCLSDMQGIVPELEFVSAEARAWQAEFVQLPPAKDDIDIVPVARGVADQLAQPLCRLGHRNSYDSCRQTVRVGSMSRRTARRILSESAGIDEIAEQRRSLAFIADNDSIHWDRIKQAIDAGEQPMVELGFADERLVMLEDGLLVPAARS